MRTLALHALLLFALLLFTAPSVQAQDDAPGGGQGAQGGGQGAVPRGAQGAAVREADPAPKPTVVEPALVHFEPPVTGPLDNPVEELVLPAWWVAGLPADLATAEDVTTRGGAVQFELGPHCFLYDRLGLRRRPKDERTTD